MKQFDSEKKENKAICITGMHRSGTSLTTSWLESCGLQIHDGQSHGPATGNPKGHFEDKEFVDLHSKAISHEYPLSNGWKVIRQKELSFTDSQLISITSLINLSIYIPSSFRTLLKGSLILTGGSASLILNLTHPCWQSPAV